jgi:hypothetical protein
MGVWMGLRFKIEARRGVLRPSASGPQVIGQAVWAGLAAGGRARSRPLRR